MGLSKFHKLPHKDGDGKSVGNPLAKAFLDKIQSGVLATYVESNSEEGNLAEKVLKISKMLSYWKSSHDRIKNQIVVKTPDENKAIIPQIVTAGTLTRRAVEKTWLTASNAKTDRVGSELKAMVMAPPGHTFVGADVDSQELWIAAVIGDSHFTGEHGSTALGWMTLQGTKSEGTDMHSVTAKTVGVSRDEAKILNYGRIYGAGVRFASQLLQNFNPTLEKFDANQLANKMYLETKGDRSFVLNELGALCYYFRFGEFGDDFMKFNNMIVGNKDMLKCVKEKYKMDLLLENVKSVQDDLVLSLAGSEMAVQMDIPHSDADGVISRENVKWMFESLGHQQVKIGWDTITSYKDKMSKKSLWLNGSESHTFNKLEDIALNRKTQTPILGCAISKALDSRVVGRDYLPSRINWVVQSSAVDYLHLLLTSMQWLMETFQIEGRFVISIHDEVRYLVKEEDKYRAALALQFANLLVRAMFCSRLGMNSMPVDIAFFSGLDIDKVMRKEPTADCVTPSNPQGLCLGYGIPKGECLTIDDLIEKTGGKIDKVKHKNCVEEEIMSQEERLTV